MAFNENTRMTPEWITRVWNDNPCRKLPNGNIIFLARTAFCNVLERPKPGTDGKKRAFGSVLLIPDLQLIGGPTALQPLQTEYEAQLKEKMPAALANEDLRAKLHDPFKKQGSYINTKSKDADLYDGFVPGRFCISANSSQSQPAVVDQMMAPVIDKARVYSGCWVIAAVRGAWIINPQNPGPTFYLQSLMVVADDNSLGGVGQSNPNADFAGVKVDQSVNPAAMFGADGATSGAQAAAPAIDLFA
jgi:hypothetical protein